MSNTPKESLRIWQIAGLISGLSIFLFITAFILRPEAVNLVKYGLLVANLFFIAHIAKQIRAVQSSMNESPRLISEAFMETAIIPLLF